MMVDIFSFLLLHNLNLLGLCSFKLHNVLQFDVFSCMYVVMQSKLNFRGQLMS